MEGTEGTEGRSNGNHRTRVLIAGAGVAALEAALALRELAGDRVAVELCAPSRHFLYRPFAVGEPYGAARVLHYDLERLARRCGASLRLGAIASVEAERRLALTRGGERLSYDYLLLAPGARALWAVPGAATFWGIADEGGVGSIVSRLRAGGLRDVIFTMPDGCSWALPLYELALLASAVLARSGVEGARLVVVTPEQAPLGLFGRVVSERVGALLCEHGIAIVTGAHPVGFEAGLLRIVPGEPIEADAVISLPRLEGRRIAGVPHDPHGFVAVDGHGRVLGMERVFAAGDVTTFPIKQGGIATQQADAAAEAIAAELAVGVEPARFDPVLRGVLWTGERPRYLYGRPSGGQGEVSALGDSPPWPEGEGKIVGRYLTPLLTGMPNDGSRTLTAGPSRLP